MTKIIVTYDRNNKTTDSKPTPTTKNKMSQNKNNSSICYLLVLLVAILFLPWIDVLHIATSRGITEERRSDGKGEHITNCHTVCSKNHVQVPARAGQRCHRPPRNAAPSAPLRCCF